MNSSQKRRIWLENFKQAFQTIRSHKFRSFLTVLGVLIGIVTVVLVASILTGMRANLVNLIEEYGTNTIYAFHLDTGIRTGHMTRKEWMRKPLKLDYVRPIIDRCNAVRDLGYVLIPRNMSNTVKFQGQDYKDGRLGGISPNYFEVLGINLAQGRPFTETDDTRRLMNCILGPDVAKALFPHMNPLEKSLIIGGKNYVIVGVTAKRKNTFFGENEEDNSIYVPFQTMQKISPREEWIFMFIRAKSGMVGQAIDQVEQVLRAERKVKVKDESDFSLSTSDTLIKQFDSITALIGVITIAISGVGLLVGGIGVMNILLVSVRERTREIGVRKALGARRKDITIQFLIEAMTLTGIGGAAGIVLAIIFGFVISLLFPTIPAVIPMWAVMTAVLVSVSIGLVFGVWPATRAARLDPIECLRYE